MTTQPASGQLSPRLRFIAIIAMFFLFAMISFVTNLAAPIGTIWGYQHEGNSFLGMMGNMMNFLAYLFMGVPAGNLLQKIGYKKTALCAMAIGAAGLFIQWTSSIDDNLIIYLTGAFVCGLSVCMLNTVVNPMLNYLGNGGNRGNQLIQTGGAINSLSGTLTPFFVGVLVGELTKETTIKAVTPLLWIAIGVFIASFIIISFIAIPEPNLNKNRERKSKLPHSALSFRHTVLGLIGIFFYVGIEVGIPGTLNFYLSDQGQGGAGVIGAASTIAGAIVALYWLLMLCGRTLSSFISGKVSSRTQLMAVSAVAIVLVILAICTPVSVTLPVPPQIYSTINPATGEVLTAMIPVSAYLLVLCGLCTSVMWGNIFNLAVEGLGKYTDQASGFFMTMVVGGGLIPLAQQLIAKSVGYMASYWLIAICLGYLLFYGISGSKNVNTDIPTDNSELNAL